MEPSPAPSADRGSPRQVPPLEGRWDRARRIGDVWQWLGTSGGLLGTNGVAGRTLLYCAAIAIVVVGAVNAVNVITTQHEAPQLGLAPIVWEGTSWLTFSLFLWIAWIAYRIAPL